MRWVRLKHSAGVFVDEETGFSVSRDECKPLVPPLGNMTRHRLNAGGLVYCDPPDGVIDGDAEPEASSVPNAPVLPPEPVEAVAPGPEPKVGEPAPEPEAKSVPEPEEPEQPAEPSARDALAERVRRICDDMTVKQMKDRLSELGIGYRKSDRQADLAELLAIHELETE